MQYERFFDVSVKNAESTQKEGQKGHFEAFLDPWLAQASLWLA